MKKIFLTSWLLVLLVAAFGQQKETRKLGSFKGIKVSQAIDVYLKKGDKEEARVEISGESKITLEDVLTDVSGSTLRVHLANGSWRRVDVKVYVTYVSLEKISASSAGNVFSDATIKCNTMDVSASSAGSVEVVVDAAEVTADASSAGRIELGGTTKSLDVEASSAGDVDAYNLTCEAVNARASSAGSVKVMASKEIDAHASSGGDVRYRGNPSRTNTGSSSGGSVKKSN
jgi:Putative auto-transporter adhesin, head GIN domain